MAAICARFHISPREFDEITMRERDAMVRHMKAEARARQRGARR